MVKKIVILSLSIILIIKCGFSQNKENSYFSAELGIGSMIIPENKSLLNDYIPNVDLSFAKSMKGSTSEYVKKLNVSYQILTFTYMNQSDLNGMEFDPNYPNRTQTNNFGNAYMLTYSLMINILGKEKNQFLFVPGWGLAYDSKTYYDDNYNVYIGSHLNYAIRLEGQFHHHLNEKNILIVGIKYMHYSNGSWTLPNRGINSITAKIGLAFKLK